MFYRLFGAIFIFSSIIGVPTQGWCANFVLTPRQPRYLKLQKTLTALGIADPSLLDPLELIRWDRAATYSAFRTLVKYVDPNKVFRPYATWTTDSFTLFEDRDTRRRADFRLRFKAQSPSEDPNLLLSRLQSRKHSKSQPLAGLRVALDPGHFAGPFWNSITGKYVKRGNVTLSEGTLALHTCLLLAQELRELGAEVMLTRTTDAPVTPLDYATFELEPFAREELAQRTDEPWANLLLAKRSAFDAKLLSAFRSRLHELSGEKFRTFYFLYRADLLARAEKINAFHPQLVIILHYDAGENGQGKTIWPAVQRENNEVRAYVPGNILPGELARRSVRHSLARTLVDGHRWIESAVFASHVVQSISNVARVSVRNDPDDVGAIRVGKGVYARNLALSRLIAEGATAYVEALRYDYEPEFNRLLVQDRRASFEGTTFEYSSRLDEVVAGLKQGILSYVDSLEKPRDGEFQQKATNRRSGIAARGKHRGHDAPDNLEKPALALIQ